MYKWNTHPIYRFDEEMGEISGFGGSYEEGCRFMVKVGLEFWDSNKDFDPLFEGFKNVYGICIADNEDAKALSDHIINSLTDYFGDDYTPTGAMHQAAISHIFFIHKNGWDKYREEMIQAKKEHDEEKKVKKSKRRNTKSSFDCLGCGNKIEIDGDPMECINNHMDKCNVATIDEQLERFAKKLESFKQ